MRDIEEIEDDLKCAQQELSDEDAEVCFHQEKVNDAQRDVDEYTKELRETKFKLGLVT
jgi:peptidoglycan hydrolase CwlO-like protein